MAWKELDDTQRQVLINLYAACAPTVDELPYTTEFDDLRKAFNGRTGLDLSSRDFWRAIASARKSKMLPRKER